MQDDLISALTLEVKEEVIQNYLHERRLIEEQINYVKELAEHALQLDEKLYRRFARIYDLLAETKFINEFAALIGMESTPFIERFQKAPDYQEKVRFIKVRGFTDKAKYKKLLVESYKRILTWNDKYGNAIEELENECGAVNYNIKKFEDNHDILTIINFLRNMDVHGVEKKHFLGDNFTPKEMLSVEASLHFKNIKTNQFKLKPLLKLPSIDSIQKQLTLLANSVCERNLDRMKAFIKTAK